MIEVVRSSFRDTQKRKLDFFVQHLKEEGGLVCYIRL